MLAYCLIFLLIYCAQVMHNWCKSMYKIPQHWIVSFSQNSKSIGQQQFPSINGFAVFTLEGEYKIHLKIPCALNFWGPYNFHYPFWILLLAFPCAQQWISSLLAIFTLPSWWSPIPVKLLLSTRWISQSQFPNWDDFWEWLISWEKLPKNHSNACPYSMTTVKYQESLGLETLPGC